MARPAAAGTAPSSGEGPPPQARREPGDLSTERGQDRPHHPSLAPQPGPAAGVNPRAAGLGRAEATEAP
jgi:hypothetical protein